MSREDPQFRIRLPIELKEKIEAAAKGNNRSLNAEIVFRLDASFIDDLPDDEIISANQALEIIEHAKEEISSIIYKRTFSVIREKIRMGHTSFTVNLTDLDLEGLDDDDFISVFKKTFEKLEELGYEVPDSSWDLDGFFVLIPS